LQNIDVINPTAGKKLRLTAQNLEDPEPLQIGGRQV
jgi:hypothetical protein